MRGELIQMNTISLCMIVKNEEQSLPKCLESVKDVVDEIIIIDTGSTDRTKELAKTFTDKIYDFEWINDFGSARNYSFSKATKDFILWLDADDVFTDENREKLLTLKKTLSLEIDAVSMLYHLNLNEDGSPSFSSRRNRLVKRVNNFKWVGFVHEYLEVAGNIIPSDIAVHHQKERHSSNRNLLIYEKALESGHPFSPRDKYYYANECNDNQKYEKAIYWYQYFLEEGLGWSEDNIQACGKLSDCFLHLKRYPEAMDICQKSFRYDAPRGEICCRLGFLYLEQNDLVKAISWYKLATVVEIPEKSPFINRSCYTWLPNLQLCLCYSRLGHQEIARSYNDKAAEFLPNNSQIQYNQEFFKQYFGE